MHMHAVQETLWAENNITMNWSKMPGQGSTCKALAARRSPYWLHSVSCNWRKSQWKELDLGSRHTKIMCRL